MLAPNPALPPKPQGFRPAGRVRLAARVNMARRAPNNTPINRYKQGLKYEKKALEHLESVLAPSGTLIIEPCFRFSNGHRSRFCFPDALLALADRTFDILIEIKSRHTYDGWWQLRKLYEPVVAKALQRSMKLLEVVKSYDPGVRLPEDNTRVLENVADVITSNAPYNIYIWSGRL